MSGWDQESTTDGWETDGASGTRGPTRRTRASAYLGLVVGALALGGLMLGAGYYGLVQESGGVLGGIAFFVTMAFFPISVVSPMAPFFFVRRNYPPGFRRLAITALAYAVMLGFAVGAVLLGIPQALGITEATEGIAAFNTVLGLVVGGIAGYWFAGGRRLENS